HLAHSCDAGRHVEDHDDARLPAAADEPQRGGVRIGVAAGVHQAGAGERSHLDMEVRLRPPHGQPLACQLEAPGVTEQLHESDAAPEYDAGGTEPDRVPEQRRRARLGIVHHVTLDLDNESHFHYSVGTAMDASPIRLDFVRYDPDAESQRRRRWCRIVARRLARGLRASDATDVLAAGALAAGLGGQGPDGLTARRRAGALADAALIAADTPLAPGVRAILEDAAEDLLGAGAETAPSTVAHRLCAALRSVAERGASGAQARSLEAAVPGFVAEHLDSGARLGDLARRLGYSVSHCSAL